MNGAELLMKTAKKAGIEVCFSNFGTTEVPLATDSYIQYYGSNYHLNTWIFVQGFADKLFI